MKPLVTNTMQSIIACAINHGLTLTTGINGNAEKWASGCRDEHGNIPSTEAFAEEWHRQVEAKKQRDSMVPSPEVDDE